MHSVLNKINIVVDHYTFTTTNTKEFTQRLKSGLYKDLNKNCHVIYYKGNISSKIDIRKSVVN